MDASAHDKSGQSQVRSDLKQRRDQRATSWKAICAGRASAEAARRERVTQIVDRMRETLRGPKIASIGSWPGKATLYAGEFEYRKERYPLTQDVTATVDQQGNVTTSQGWVMTQHDSREIYVNVEGRGWYASVRTAKGGAASTDLSITLSNSEFRQNTKSAREFAKAVNTAAAKSTAFAEEARREHAEQLKEARAAFADVSGIEAKIDEQRRVASEQRAAAQADLATAQALAAEAVGPHP